MTLQRKIVDWVADRLKIHVIRYGHLATHLEHDYLRRMFDEARIDCIFDVGANSGQYARMTRHLGYAGPIISFEPMPDFCALLRTQAAKDPMWFIEECALDAEAGSTAFNVMEGREFSSINAPNSTETSLWSQYNKVVQTIEVKKETLDNAFSKYREKLGFRRPYLKMDTQGYDLNVARGGSACLGEFVALQSELAILRLYEGQPDYRQSIDVYELLGFQLSAFVPNNAGAFPQMVETDCIMFNRRFWPDLGDLH